MRNTCGMICTESRTAGEDAEVEFGTGSLVRYRVKRLFEGEHLVAIEALG
jgi:hypothetical protein